MPKTRLWNVDVVLVRPQAPANIGFIARSCKAFGCGGIRVVHPNANDLLTSEAYRTASGAQEVLESILSFPKIGDAVNEHHLVVGFSRRKHEFERPLFDLREWVESRFDCYQKIALLFGAEDFGLSNEEKHFCDVVVNIPAECETLSLNLSHAVTVVLYELFQQSKGMLNKDKVEHSQRVTHNERERLLQKLIAMLDDSTFFKEGRRTNQVEILRNLIGKMQLQQQEYHTLMGVLNALEKQIRVE